MAQKTFVDGDVLTASDINTYLSGEGGAWTSFTPTVGQSGAVTVTNTRSRYARYGRTIHFTISLSVTGSGTGGNNILISLPVTAASAGEAMPGTGVVVDTSAGLTYVGWSYIQSTTECLILTDVGTALGAAVFTAALASGDTIKISGTYEAAA